MLQILSIENYAGLKEVMVGTPVLRCSPPAHFAPGYYSVTISLADKKRINDWARAHKVAQRVHTKSFTMFGMVGYASTPEEIAYDEIDQQEDETSRPLTGKPKTRSRTVRRSKRCSGPSLSRSRSARKD